MRKILGYRKVLGVGEKADLQELKTVYRTMMKNWHPDKFQDSPEAATEAEVKSKHIIEAYHFLVSIAPETLQTYKEAYDQTIATSAITNFEYKSETLQVTFADGSSYEYFGVPKSVYNKFINAPVPTRFIRRHVCGSFFYRSCSQN